MTVEYGYLGSLDVGTGRIPTLQSDGEPIYTPALENRWAKELQSSDGAWRFLKGGTATASSYAVHDFQTDLTVLALAKISNGITNYQAVCNKHQNTVNPGYDMLIVGNTAVKAGLYLQCEGPVGTTNITNAYSPLARRGSIYDANWSWIGGKWSGTPVTLSDYLNGALLSTKSTSITDMRNAGHATPSYFTVTNSAKRPIACLLIYNRVLTDTEVANICSGKTLPLEVPGCVGYYKFNETHGTANGQCTDYSGQGNHLTYSGAVWEVFDPASPSYQSGQPYVLRTQRNNANWWERVPPAIADPERMGCLHIANGAASVSGNAIVDSAFMGDFTICGWRKLNARANQMLMAVTSGGYAGPVAAYVADGRVTLRLGNNSTHTVNTFTRIANLSNITNRFVFWSIRLSGSLATLSLNGVDVETITCSGTRVASTQPLYFCYGGSGTFRSNRLFSRALSAAEVNELFLTDKISDRSGLVGEWLMNTPHTTTITDTSGNGLNTTTTNPLLLDSPYTVPRRKRKGKQLAQSTGAFVQLPAGLLTAITGLSQLTLSCWVKLQKGSGQYPSFMRLENSGQTIAELYSQDSGGVLYAAARSVSTDTAQTVSLSGAKVAPFNQWFLFSLSIDLSAATVSAYINGKLYGTLAATFGQSTFATCTAGRLHGTAAKRNAIDAARIYNRALTAQEHYQLYLDQAPRNGLVAEYLFDNDVSSCLDSSGNGFHATWSGITAANYVKEM